jgi:predicted ArsR family transcriptional regulator
MEIIVYIGAPNGVPRLSTPTIQRGPWREHTSAFDRVRTVALSLSEPRTAAWIAGEALVAENTARDHLERLVDMRMVQTRASGTGTTYYPDPVYVRTREIRSLVEDHDRDALLELAADLKADIEAWADAYDGTSSDEIRAEAARPDRSEAETRERRRVASDWEHARYRLSLVEDALDRYGEFTGRPSTA